MFDLTSYDQGASKNLIYGSWNCLFGESGMYSSKILLGEEIHYSSQKKFNGSTNTFVNWIRDVCKK